MTKDLPTLIIIDMQKGMATAAAGERNNLQAEENIARLLAAWRAAAGTVVFVRHISRTPGSLFWPGQPGAEFQEQLTPVPAEHVVEKNVPDCFINTGLERWLRVRGITQLVLVGVSTNNSVESSARTAGNLGFTTQVVSDATYAYAKKDYAGQQRSADDVHNMALSNLDDEYASIIDTATLIRCK